MFPKVSIQIPTYNQAHCIGKAVQSAIEQSYPNLEINIIDDCSTDNTKDVLSAFMQHANVTYYRNEKNIGRVANYRKGVFEIASGELIVNLDGDDYFINNDFIKDAVTAIMELGLDNTIMYMASMKYGEEQAPVYYSPNIDSPEIIITGKIFFEKYFKHNYFTHFGIVANKALVKEQITSYTKNISSSDIYTFLTICLNNPQKKIILSKKLSGFWVWNGNNFSKTLSLKDYWKNYAEIALSIKKGLHVSGIYVYVKWLLTFTILTWGSYIKKKLIGKK